MVETKHLIIRNFKESDSEKCYESFGQDETLGEYLLIFPMADVSVMEEFINGCMVGLAMGSVKHWYSATQYYIDELCIIREEQGRGLGTRFLQYIEEFLLSKGIPQIFLQTDRPMPAYEFYKKNGFIELEDHVSFYKECGTEK
ncbi:MAG: GNAT family N-acetyltransferase [bacterium]|nr:GNAT family N-acetyltransferase [bacterium]